MRLFLPASIVLPLSLIVAPITRAQPGETRTTVTGSDGAQLQATWFSPGKPGPGVLLLHQCDMNRHSWDELARALVSRGMHVLTMDYRGYGDSRTIAGDYQRLPGDIDAALAALIAKPGVYAQHVAVGGASCGVNNAVQLARRSGKIGALLLLSGSTDSAGHAFIEQATVPIFLSYSADEGGPLPQIKRSVSLSKNPASVTRELSDAGHGVRMFAKVPSLVPEIADWLARVLH